MNPPPAPINGDNILEWAKRMSVYVRRLIPIRGEGVRTEETERGVIISSPRPQYPVGTIVATMADLYGEITGNPTHAEGLRNDLLADGWIPCDGATLNTADYPRLANAIGANMAGATFTLPDPRGRMLMGWDNRGTPAAHSDAYAVQGVGGYRRHGQTENNHHDHEFAVSLTHTHTVPINSTTLCTTFPTGSPATCAVGSAQDVLIPSASDPETSGPTFDPTGDNVPTGEGSIARSGTGDAVVTVTLKHKGDDGDGTPDAPGTGNAIDDVDNRPPYIVANWIIKAF